MQRWQFVVGLLVFGCNQSPAPPSISPADTAPEVESAAAAPSAAPPPHKPTRPALRDADIPWDATPTLEALGRIAAEVADTEYVHYTQVDRQRGIYRFDCSGMAAWVLQRSAPVAHAQTVAGLRGRPLAQTYERVIRHAPDTSTKGWQRVRRLGDVRPGDVIAWRKPERLKSKNTGHVAFVVLPPYPLPDHSDAYLVRVVDSTSLHHQDDSRTPGNMTGFGYGTILVVVDDENEPIGYGWVGILGPIFQTDIAVGRPLS